MKDSAIPKGHVPVRVPVGTHKRLQPSLQVLRMPNYDSPRVWLLSYAPLICYN